MSAYVHEFWFLTVIHILALISPGPDFAVTVAQSLRYGKRIGMLTATGIGCGILVHVSYSLLGLAAILKSSPQVYRWVQLAGVCYLLYFALHLWWSAYQNWQHKNAQNTPQSATLGSLQTYRSAWLTGFLTNLLNPKAGLFFITVFSTIISLHTPWWLQGIYGIWMFLLTILWFSLVAILLCTPSVQRQFLRYEDLLSFFMGAIILFFALRLLLS